MAAGWTVAMDGRETAKVIVKVNESRDETDVFRVHLNHFFPLYCCFYVKSYCTAHWSTWGCFISALKNYLRLRLVEKNKCNMLAEMMCGCAIQTQWREMSWLWFFPLFLRCNMETAGKYSDHNVMWNLCFQTAQTVWGSLADTDVCSGFPDMCGVTLTLTSV